MCGVSFYCCTNTAFPLELDESLRTISHRGPDGSGIAEKKIGKFDIGIGHNRLSIVDLSGAGDQPMVLNSGNILSFNGEIYNYRELRAALIELGVIFQGNSDTEVILRLFEFYGVAAFGMLEGMFAFVLLDMRNEKFYIVRDIVGIKPIYIFQDSQNIYGCSEIKGLKKFSGVKADLDRDDVYEFFNQGFLYEPSTGYKFIKKLLPGHYFEVDLKSAERRTVSFECDASSEESGTIAAELRRSITQQQESEVPLGLFFSGGLDSSVLAGLFDKPKLFFAKYDDSELANIDLEYSTLIAKFLEKELHVSEMSITDEDPESLLKTIDFVAINSEELISDYTFLATYRLSCAARKHGYKVMLSGMGGDEVFAGYPRYTIVKYDRLIRLFRLPLKILLGLKMFPSKWSKKFERLVSYVFEKNWVVAYSRLLGYFTRAELSAFFSSSYQELDSRYLTRANKCLGDFGPSTDKVKMAQHLDAKGFLAHNLSVSDKASMLASIELRVPLLSERLFSFGKRAPSKRLINKNKLKFPLWDFAASVFPLSLLERPKTGFNPPLDGLVEKIGKVKIKEELSSLSNVLNLGAIYLLVDRHFLREQDNTYKLWQLLYFSRWLKAHSEA